MMSNTALWDKLGRTDPAHTKGFSRSGGFKGTAIKPMYSFHRMTEEFGPCGQGWGVNTPAFQVVPGTDGETLVYCTVSIWHADRANIVFGVGGDKVVVKYSSGLKSDDEAFKKAFTDAITNALKLIGVGADVHMGLFDDSKYVNDLKAEMALNSEADDIMAWSSKLSTASNMGVAAIAEVWAQVPKHLKPNLEAEKNALKAKVSRKADPISSGVAA